MENGEATGQRRKACHNYRIFSLGAWVILIHELLERFSFYGMKGILTLYMVQYLEINENVATAIYHLFTALAYLAPIFGAWVSDNYWGRFKTIAIFGAVYLVGHALMPLTALKPNIPGPMIAITVLALGTGMIKPCVAAFGGDQIPEDEHEALGAFFALFYLAINVGAFISQFLTPILREDIKCFGKDCYAVGYGVPAVAFLVTYVLFLAFKKYYVIKPTQGNVLNDFCRYLITPKRKVAERFDPAFVADVKISLRVMFLFLPFPIFWALFDQQGSRWTLQAKQMDGYISDSFYIKPEQMQMVNPLLILVVIPLFNNIIYPLFAKCNLFTKATTRMFFGYLFASAAFIYTGIIQLEIDKGLPQKVDDNSPAFRYINGFNCSVIINAPGHTITDRSGAVVPNTKLEKFTTSANLQINNYDWKTGNSTDFEVLGSCIKTSKAQMVLRKGKHSELIFYDTGFSTLMNTSINPDIANIRVLATAAALGSKPNATFLLNSKRLKGKQLDKWWKSEYEGISDIGKVATVNHSEFGEVFRAKVSRSTTYTIIITGNQATDNYIITSQKLTLVHMLVQLPQYAIMCVGEVLFSVTAMAFAYSEAPDSMKALMQSTYLITIFFGNIIVTIVAVLPGIDSQAWEFFLFAILVAVAALVQGVIIWGYYRMKNRVDPQMELTEKRLSVAANNPSNGYVNEEFESEKL